MPKSKFAYREDDLVRIVTQPENQFADLRGLTAYIEEIEGSHATVVAFSLEGRVTGTGTVPQSCLEPVTDPQWKAAKKKLDAHFQRIDDDAEKRVEAWKKRVARVAKRFGLSPKKVQDIYDLLNDEDETGR